MFFLLMESFLLTIICICGGILPLRLKPSVKIVLSLVVCCVAFKFQLLQLIGGPAVFSPDVPGLLLLASGWLFGILMFWTMLILLWNIIRVFVLLLLKITGRGSNSFFRHAQPVVSLCAAVVLASFGVYSGTSVPDVREVTVKVSRLAPDAEGLTVALVSDLHSDNLTGASKIRKIVEKINALSPDVIVLTGDLADGTPEMRADDLAPLRSLHSKFGTFAVPGNHEYYCDYEPWSKFLPTLGQTLLENSATELNGTDVVIAGVTDFAAVRFKKTVPDLAKALQNIDMNTKTVILLAHQPRGSLIAQAEEKGVALQLSGHTHGGMILGLDRIIAKMNGGYVRGLYYPGRMALYVNPGSSLWNGFPIRFGIPSEITLIRLSSR